MQSAPSSPPWTADFGTRWSAFAIDAAILFCAQWVMFIVVSRQLQAVGMTSEEPCIADGIALCEGPSTALWALLLALLLVTTVAYHAVFEGLYGATPGKRWMGLQVVTSKGESPIGLAAGVQRSFVRQLFWLSLFFIFDSSPLDLGLPAGLFILIPVLALAAVARGAFAIDGRSLHDLAARTQVVRASGLDAMRRQARPSPAQSASTQVLPVVEETEESV